ncbi:unnamed protein product, partial [Meganyctiphanes norvegica]
MTGRYGKTFSRKKAATPPPIEEFDAIVTDNTSHANRASATKTAGHVGKWGTTVFTSMRQTHFNGGVGRDEGGGTKRPAPSESPPSDPYNYVGSAPANGAPKPTQTYKPRKFFKSRNAEPRPEPRAEIYSASKGSKSDSQSDKSSYSERDSNRSKEVSSSSQDILFDKLVNSNKTNANAGGTKSGSGIKLKIFKSRNEASSSQDTYSSTVELPSDDSRATSTSNSVCSSPSYKDSNDDSLDTPESLKDYNELKTKSNSVKSLETKTILNKDSLRVPDNKTSSPNISLNSTLDSSVEFMGYISQTTGLPVCDDSDASFNVQKTPSDVKPINRSYASKVRKPFSKSKELNKYLNQNVITSSVVDSEELINDSVCSGTLSEDFDPLGVSNSFVETPLEIPPLTRSVSPVDSSSSVEKCEEEEPDLFSVDFDENDIQDRTIDDISEPVENKNSPSTQSDTQDDDLLFTMTEASRSTYKTFKRSTSSKSVSEISKKEVEKPPAIVKKRSIFKSRNKATESGEEKKKATYKHKWHDHDENEDPDKKEGGTSSHHGSSQSSSMTSTFDDFDFDAPSNLKRVQTWPGATTNLDDSMEDQSSVTSVKCTKRAKQNFFYVKLSQKFKFAKNSNLQKFNDCLQDCSTLYPPNLVLGLTSRETADLTKKSHDVGMDVLGKPGITKRFFVLSHDENATLSSTLAFVLLYVYLGLRMGHDLFTSFMYLLNTIDTNFHDPKCRIAFMSKVRQK